VEVKKKLFAAIDRFLEPIRERRAEFAARPDLIDEILHAGNQVMRAVAVETMGRVREAMGITYFR
jgi:tryptophanyl-tRNA synthetase